MKRYTIWFTVMLVILLVLPVTAFADDGTTTSYYHPEQLDDIYTVLRAIIPIAAVPRIIQCLCVMAMDAEQESSYKKRLKNLLIFVVVAECALSLLFLIYRYFS